MNSVSWGAAGLVVGAFVTGLFAWVVQRAKGRTDIAVAVTAEWQKLNLALSNRVSMLEEQLAQVRASHASEIEEMRRQHRAEIKLLRDWNEGLQRQIAQNSQSTAHLLGDVPGKDSDHDK